MTELGSFDPNDYRKRVLAAVERRGGPDASDPFELYDLPLTDDLPDAAVADRIGEVWGAWQRQRDHPKYRVLVALLVAGHAERSAELLDGGRRRLAAARVRAQRAQRESARYELLDAAASRLVQRHRGIPADKIEGLYAVGALAGLDRDEVARRLRRHRLLDPARPPASAPALIGPERRRQIRALLDEFGRLSDVPAPPTLLALIGLDPAATDEQVRARAGAWRSRARELPPVRLRAVLDELLVHVAELVEPGRAAVETYLDAVAADVAEHLRPRLRAAVLVEDRLLPDDHAYLLDEAAALGLDRWRAAAVVAGLAAEEQAPRPVTQPPVGAAPSPPDAAPSPVGADPPPAGAAPPPAPEPPGWEEPLAAARAELRAGRPAAAQRLVREAERLAGRGGNALVSALTGDITAVIAEAERRARAARTACDARRWAAALPHLEHLHRTAHDTGALTDLDGLLQRARRHVAAADAAVAAATQPTVADRERALLAVLDACPDHPGAIAALALIPVDPPAWVSTARTGSAVLVLWAPSRTPGVTYRVSRLRPDGGWQVLGRAGDTSLEDGGVPPGVEVPVYAVSALQAGRSSPATRSDGSAPDGGDPADPAGGVDTPQGVRAARLTSGSVQVSWTGAADVEYRVRCQGPDGRWRVVGRTSRTVLEDGGAPAGPVPVYAVSAARDGVRSAEGRSDG